MKLFRFIKLNKIEEKKSGAGELGTSELVNQYKQSIYILLLQTI